MKKQIYKPEFSVKEVGKGTIRTVITGRGVEISGLLAHVIEENPQIKTIFEFALLISGLHKTKESKHKSKNAK